MKRQILLEARNVTNIFLKKNLTVEANKNVSLEIYPNEIVSIVGPSGCGKTTLIKSLAGFLQPTKGSVSYKNKVLNSPNPEIGIIFQNHKPFPWLTVEGNIASGLYKLSKDEQEKRVNKYLKRIGLSDFRKEYPHQLSGGMRQRVSLARALANEPNILLLDEPFSSLDPQTKTLMQELMLSIWEETQKTLLFVTHDIEEAIFLSDKIYVMSSKPGEITKVIDNLLPKPRLAEQKLSEEFINLRKHINYLIRSESLKAAQINLQTIRPHALKIGLHLWVGNASLILGQELDLFKKNNLEVQIISLEKDKDRLSALEDGSVDIITTTIDMALIAKNKGLDIKIIGVTDESTGSDALLVNNNIKQVKDIIGKRIGVERGWSHFFLLHILDKNKINISDVRIEFMNNAEIGSAIINKRIDGGVLLEPWLTHTKKLSNSKTLISTEEEPVIPGIIITTNDCFEKKKEQLQKFSTATIEALEYIKNNPKESKKLMAIPLGISTKEFEISTMGVTFLGRKENKNIFSNEKIRKLITHTSKILYNAGEIKQNYSPD